ncbi:MAG: PKD domain-containing protein, partial [Thermoplasmata archaeon]
NLPGATESIPPVADARISPGPSVTAGTSVTLDATHSTDNAEIVYYGWSLWDGVRDVEMYGDTVSYRFDAVGNYEVQLTVVDSSWNFNETKLDVTVNPSDASDTIPPTPNAGDSQDIQVGQTVNFDGINSTDNVAITNWTWVVEDVFDRVMYGPKPSYTFQNSGNFWVQMYVRDASGNQAQAGVQITVNPMGGDWTCPEPAINDLRPVNVGDTVTLDAGGTRNVSGGATYTWYIRHNYSMITRTGEVVNFTPTEWGLYQVTLAVRTPAGNLGIQEREVIVFPEGVDVNEISWTSTPFGQDVSFNLLTYSYGIALLASVIYVGGLFAKGFAHEITRGTVKVLMSGPISVTTVIFSKILYPLIVGPFFIFPLVFIGLSRFDHPAGEIFLITLVSYAMAALTMISAAYGSCLIYLGTKRMVIKPSAMSRMLLYFSLLATMTVFEWTSFLLDTWTNTDVYGNTYHDYGPTIALFSPFHQGGLYLAHELIGAARTPDLAVFVIPIVLIVLGGLASRKLYTDIFSRE